MAKAQPTSTLMEMPATKMPSVVMTIPMTMAERAEGPDAPVHDVVREGAGHADQEAGRGRQEGGEGARGHQSTERGPDDTGGRQSREDQDDRVGLARHVETGRLESCRARRRWRERRRSSRGAGGRTRSFAGRPGRHGSCRSGPECGAVPWRRERSPAKCRRWRPTGGSVRRPGAATARSTPSRSRSGCSATWGARAPAGNVRVVPECTSCVPLVRVNGPSRCRAVDPADGRDADAPVDGELLRSRELDRRPLVERMRRGTADRADRGMVEEHHQEDGGNGQCRDLEPVLEGLHEGDALHAPARDAQGHDDTEDDDPDPFGAAEGHLQRQPRSL